MTSLPAAAAFQAEPMTALAMSDLMVQLRDCLAGLLGTDGIPATALAALGALGAGYAAKTAAYTVATTDRGKLINATSGTWTLTLPAVATAGAGFAVMAANTGTGTITLDGNASETIDGTTTAALAPGRAALVICTGAAWVTLALPGRAAGPVIVPAGSAAAPGLTPAGDSNTGVYAPAADQIGLATGGTLRALLSSAGLQLDVPLTGTAVVASDSDTTAGRVLTTGAGPAQAFRRGNVLGTVSQSAGVPTGAVIERGSNANGEYVRFADGTQICVTPTMTVDLTTAQGSLFTAAAVQEATMPAAFATTLGMSAFLTGVNTENAWGVARLVTSSLLYWRAFRTTSVAGQQFRVAAIGRWF